MQWPIEEIENLRHKQISITGEKLQGGSTLEVSGINASQVSKLLQHISKYLSINFMRKYIINDNHFSI